MKLRRHTTKEATGCSARLRVGWQHGAGVSTMTESRPSSPSIYQYMLFNGAENIVRELREIATGLPDLKAGQHN